MASPLLIRFREFDANGAPLSGGKLYSYEAGTTTKKATYNDPECTTPNVNPVILDSEGYADIWLLPGLYKFRLDDADGATLWTKDSIPAVDGDGTTFTGSLAWTEFAIADGQSATALDGEEIDFDDYSSAIYDVEIKRGTTVAANGPLAIQNLDGVGRVVLGGFLAEEAHGVEFSLSQVGSVASLLAATDSGAGSGTIRLSKRLISV